jgi:predicted molibdopterin-dependent oxidoreductase YjgC
MVVRTETEALRKMRREILSLILSEHPYSCLVCERRVDCDDFQSTIRKAAVTTGCQYCPNNGRCELPKLVEYMDLREIPYPIAYRGLPVEHDDPFFDRDYNLCILCGRCVRVCQDMRHAGVLAFVYRGSQAIVGTAFGRSHLDANCQFCGACVDVCPTGALADKRGKWEGVPTATVSSVCPYCSVGCALNLEVKNGRVIRTTGHDDGPTNDGQLCVRGRFGVVEIVHGSSRLKTPMVRRDGKLVEASWDEALGAVAQTLSKHRGDAFAAIGSASATNEENYLLQKFTRAVMHTNNVALATSFPEHEQSTEPAEIFRATGEPSIGEIRKAKSILVIGANLFVSHPVIGVEIRHATSGGADLITVDTRETEMARQSSAWLQPRLGTDSMLLAGIIKAIADEQRRLPKGSRLAQPDLDKVAQSTGVSRDAIVSAARTLIRHTPAVIIYGSGVTHYSTGPNVTKAIHSLAFMIGDARIIGIPGEGNTVGAHDMGVHPVLLPGYRSVSKPKDLKKFEAAWKAKLSSKAGRAYEQIVDGIRLGKIKALYLAGEVPHLPELAKTEFVVLQDIVATENLQYAHVVLPITTFAEMDGTMTNLEGRVQLLRQAIQPIGLSRPGWTVFRDLAKRMGIQKWDYDSSANVMAEIRSLVPAYSEVNYDKMGVGGLVRRFEPLAKMKFVPFATEMPVQFGTEEFPLTLITERNLYHYRGACLTELVKGMDLVKKEEILQLNPSDASKFGISDGALVRVESRYGSAEYIAQAARGMPEGAAFISINPVVGSPLLPAIAPVTKTCAIRISERSQEGKM